jgi:hypothetical protein
MDRNQRKLFPSDPTSPNGTSQPAQQQQQNGYQIGMGGGSASAASGYRCVIDMVDLWRKIHGHFRRSFPSTTCPVESLAMLMILLGTDFFRRFHRMGYKSMWNAFCEGGYVFFADAIDVGGAVGVPSAVEPRPLGINESNLMNFVRFAYGYVMRKKQVLEFIAKNKTSSALRILFETPLQRRQSDPSGAVHAEALERFARATCPSYSDIATYRSKGRSIDPVPLFTEAWLMAAVRRASWNLAYWLNGHTAMCPDPTATTNEGASIYGWERSTPSALLTKNEEDDDEDDTTTDEDGPASNGEMINKQEQRKQPNRKRARLSRPAEAVLVVTHERLRYLGTRKPTRRRVIHAVSS